MGHLAKILDSAPRWHSHERDTCHEIVTDCNEVMKFETLGELCPNKCRVRDRNRANANLR
jgi:hypothetical protein